MAIQSSLGDRMVSEVEQFLSGLEKKAKELEIAEFLNRPSLKALKGAFD